MGYRWDIYGISMGYLRDNLKQVSKECQRHAKENIRNEILKPQHVCGIFECFLILLTTTKRTRNLTDGFTSSEAVSGISETVSSKKKTARFGAVFH